MVFAIAVGPQAAFLVVIGITGYLFVGVDLFDLLSGSFR